MDSNITTFVCLLYGHSSSEGFKVDIPKNKDLMDLKTAIKEMRPNYLANVDAAMLKIWKVNINLNRTTSSEEDIRLREVLSNNQEPDVGRELQGTELEDITQPLV